MDYGTLGYFGDMLSVSTESDGHFCTLFDDQIEYPMIQAQHFCYAC